MTARTWGRGVIVRRSVLKYARLCWAGLSVLVLAVLIGCGGGGGNNNNGGNNTPPVPNAGGTYTGNVGQALTFDGSKSTGSSGQALTYAWNFGDNTTGSGVNPTHSYAAVGSFTVTLTVSASGGTATATATATISAPVANAGGPYPGNIGQTLTFDGSKSTAPSGQTLTYAWNFGDSSTGTGVAPTHSFTTSGTFTVTLTVTASGGGTAATATASATISALPVANAGGPYTGNAGQTLTFDGSKSTVASGQTLTYGWSFGDSGTGTGVAPTHSYTAVGTYTVTLTVTSSAGPTATATSTVTISSLPVANAGGPYPGTPGQALTFDGSKSTVPSGQTLTYAWNFGDSSTGTGVGPTHSYTTAGTYTVTLTVTSSAGPTATATATATISALPVANAGGPYTGTSGVAVTFDGSKSTASSGQTLTYAWTFGDSGTGTGVTPTHSYSAAGTFTVTLTVTSSSGPTATATSTATISTGQNAPTITSFSPQMGSVGTLVSLTGTNLSASGSAPQILLSQQGGGTLSAPVTSSSATGISFVIPTGAATGPPAVSIGGQTATAATALTVSTSSTFTVAASPGTANLIQGQSTTLAVTVSSTTAFSGLATLSVTGLPSGVTASFAPASVSASQISILTLTAPSGQTAGTSALTISAAAAIDAQPVSKSTTASLKVAGVTTTFLGRTVVDDATETPIGGVTISFLGQDASGRATGCTGSTTSDGGGNFALSNLPSACTGPQLISYNGSTATTPSGKFAGVNLSYTLVASQVVASPVLIHLPRIDNAETVMVQQNSTTDQIFYFHTIPGVKVTVYAGTTLSLDDGSKPNPFPLVALSIPLDRLPEKMPTTGMLMPFIVAFQPANAVASQPVAVNFPNSLGVAPNTSVTFVTLDPTHGYMVPYGTGTVSNDGSEFIADADPNHPGHAYGLVHFDWHGPATQPTNPNNPAPPCGCGSAKAGDPVDVGSGLVTYTTSDLQIGGRRGGLALNRTYRTVTSNSGPFGLGTGHNYGYQLNTFPLLQGQAYIGLVMPDGNQYNLSQAPDGTFTNSTIPSLRGAVLSGSITTGTFTLKFADGAQFGFQINTSLGSRAAFLTSMTDLNGNQTTLTLNPTQPLQIQKITDPVGRSLTMTYDSGNRITQATDPIGRKVSYTYNSAGALATFTDAAGGVTKFTYDSKNNLATITDARGVVVEQNVYNESFDGRVTQQTQADGGVFKFAYVLQNPTLATSPVLQTLVTDPLGNITTYRFDMQGFMVSATDASGQTRTLTHDPNHFNLVSDYTGSGTCSVCNNPAQGDIHYTFDAYGNEMTETDALGNKTSMTYDTRFNKVNSITDPLGHTTTIKYDSNGNAISVTDANGHTTQTVYDSFGEPVQTIDPTGAKTNFAYDAFGNISSVTNALGNTTNLTYDGAGRLIQVRDALNRKGITVYDPLDRVTSVTDPNGNTSQFTYDAIGGMLSFKDAKGNSTAFAYDSRERLNTRTSPLGKSQSYQYDVDSNLTQFTDRRGQVSKFAYDAVNRITQATYFDSTVTTSYDSAGRPIAVNDSMGGAFAYAYDAAGELISQSGPTGTIKYTRDTLGRVATEQVVGLAATSYAYDSAGNMTSASNGAAGVNFTYDTRGLPITMSRLNGVISSFSFDTDEQLLSLVHAISGTALNTQNYTYAADGNRSSAANDVSKAFTTQSATATVDSANEVLTNGGTTYTYDANGNRLTEANSTATLTYAWDGRNRLTSITDTGGNKTSLRYDFSTNLLEIDKTGTSSSTQKFVIDSLTNVVALTDASGAQVSVLTGRSIDSHFASVDSSGNVAYQIGDALGGTTAVTSSTGTLSGQLYYEPYGQTAGTSTSAFPFAYTGRIPIVNGIYYNRDRYYDSATGRFLSEDPIGLAGGTNSYLYAGNNPIDRVDPNGDFWLLLAEPLAAGIANGVIEGIGDYYCHKDLSRALGKASIGFVGGAISGFFGEAGALAGGLGGAVVGGALGGAYGNLAEQALNKKFFGEKFDPGAYYLSIASGAATGGLYPKIFKTVGRLPSLFTSRFGKNSLRLIGQAVYGSTVGGTLGDIYSVSGCDCSN